MTALLALLALAPYGHDHYVSRDAMWCWFADPRAIWVGPSLLAGGVSKDGDVVAHVYDPASLAGETVTLAKAFEKDDHDNPAFVTLRDGRIAAFWSKHTGSEMWMSTTPSGNDLKTWSPPVKVSPNDPAYKGPEGALNAYTYPNPRRVLGEKNRLFLFWRGMNWKPTMSWSDDDGKTWTKGKIVVSPEGDSPANRPYTKYSVETQYGIHMAFTDGHPRNEPTNSIYYARYAKGAFRDVMGREIATLDKLPFRPAQADVVYDGRAENVRAWIWDVADDNGVPVIVYSRLPKIDQHEYRYARWNGKRFVDRKIVDAGKWFPTTPEGQTEREPHYSGGVCIDPKNPNIVYVSRPIDGRFEIERWITTDSGDSWSHVAITGESKHDSVRPFVPPNKTNNSPVNALWANLNRYVHYTDFSATIQGANEEFGGSYRTPKGAMSGVWQWVRSNPSSYTKTEWMLAPLYSGVLDYAVYTKDESALNWMRKIGEQTQWKLGPRPFMADDQAVGQAYLQLYGIDKHQEQLAATKAWADALLKQPNNETLEWKNGIHNREWAWCDSLFMAPPTLAMLSKTTGDRRYLELMNQLWWKTSDYLYDPAESLYYRDSRYFTPREANGAKVIWSRGNGWVLAGLARVLANMSPTDPLRPKFEAQFKAMAKRIAKLQTPDGTWHASLLDPASFPSKETSGTGFFTYAMAWGVNEGLLERATFAPVIDNAYRALTAALDENGRLGWVQPIGQDPKTVKATDNDAYGVGAFLLASCQVDRMRGGR